MHGLILADDLLFQVAFQAGQLGEFGLPDLHRRDARPQLNDLGHIVHGHLDLTGGCLLGGQLGFQLGDAGLALGHPLVVDGFVDVRGLHIGFFLLQGIQLLLHSQILGDDRVSQIAAGAGFVQQVDGLVRQVAVGDIAFAQGDGGAQHLGGHLHMVMLLVVVLDAVHHGQGVSHAGFLHPHRLEAALQCLILLDVLAVLGEGRSADDLDLAAGQRGLQDVARVHGTFALPGGGDGVDLVNEQDDISSSLDFAQQALDPLLELAAELGARHQTGQIQQIDLLVLQADGHIALGNALGNTLGNGGLAHTGFADEAGVVLLAAAQDLDGAVDLAVAADDVIQLSFPGLAGQVFAVIVQEFAAGRLFPVLFVGIAVAFLLFTSGKAHREGRTAAGDQIFVPRIRVGILISLPHHHCERISAVFQLFHRTFHAVFHVIEILIRHSELLHQILHRLDVQFPGAVQAIAFLLHLAALHPLDEDDGRTLLASSTDHSSSLLQTLPVSLQERVELIKQFIVKTPAQHGVIQHRQTAAGDDNDAPHHAQHQIDVQHGGACAHQPAKAPVHSADDRQLVHQTHDSHNETDQHPKQCIQQKEQHQRDDRGQQRLQHLFHNAVRQHHGVVGQHGVNGTLAGRYDGRAEARRQKARVFFRDGGQIHHTARRQAGSDLSAEAACQQIFEHPARTGGGQLVCAQQAESVAHQLHDGGQKALARIPEHQNDPDCRT